MPKIIKNLKESLIEQGKKELLNKSYKELNIREIAKACEIGTGTFYNYFKTKDEFVHEIFINDWNKILNVISNLEKKDITLKEKVYVIYTVLDEFLSNYKSIFYEMALIRGGHFEKYHYMGPIIEQFEVILELHQKNGEIKSNLSIKKLSKFIMMNIILVVKDKFITFDEMYSLLNI